METVSRRDLPHIGQNDAGVCGRADKVSAEEGILSELDGKIPRVVVQEDFDREFPADDRLKFL